MERGCSNVPSRLRDLGERRKVPQQGPQMILGRFMYNFVPFHAHFAFSVFNSCLEMGDSYIRLLASRSVVPL